MGTERGDTTVNDALRGSTLEVAFEKLWRTRGGVADLRVLGDPSGDKAASRFLLAQEKASGALKAENEDIYRELEFATDDYISKVSQEHYRLGFQDALRLMAGA